MQDKKIESKEKNSIGGDDKLISDLQHVVDVYDDMIDDMTDMLEQMQLCNSYLRTLLGDENV